MIGRDFANENAVQQYTSRWLGLFCGDVHREHRVGRTQLRVDVAGVLCDKYPVYVECKAFTKKQNVSPFAQAVSQSISYSGVERWPFFVGPVFGRPLELSNGLGGGLAGLQILAGLMNVGFFWFDRSRKECGLLLRGQCLVRAKISGTFETHRNIEALFTYDDRVGSKTIKTGVAA